MNETVSVIVTTKHRGVFYGRLADDRAPASVELHECRNVLRWVSAVGGFLGLAANGPVDECRVGPAVPKCRLYDITSITPCTEDAVRRFDGFAPWTG